MTTASETFRVTDTFISTTVWCGRRARLTCEVCEEMLEGRWEAFISIKTIDYLD